MEELRDASLDLLIDLARPTSHDTVLDFAAGAGMAGFALAPAVRSVEAADECPDALDEGRRLASELGLDNVAFTLVDLYALPYEEGSFTLVICRNAFHLLPDPATALGELARVLTTGGRVVVLDPVASTVNDRAFNDLARLREPAHRRHYLPEELVAIAAKAGFRATREGQLRSTIHLDYWLQAAAVPAAKSDLIRTRFKALPVEVQADMDVAFADRMVSFSYDIAGFRLERV